jgi:signal transduction histidine kinase
VAHEINNPLAYVSSNLASVTEQLKRVASGKVDPVEIQDALEAAQESQQGLERVKQIVRDLKGISRDDEKKDAVQLDKVLESASRMASATLRPRAKFVSNIDAAATLLGNEGRLCQVFLNLLVNAAQAIPEDGAAKNEVRLTAKLEDGRAVVEVSDTGCGMSPEVKARLFEPFFTTKPRGIGTGLGLSICQGIVAAHGGVMSVESAVGTGSTFRVELPVS